MRGKQSLTVNFLESRTHLVSSVLWTDLSARSHSQGSGPPKIEIVENLRVSEYALGVTPVSFNAKGGTTFTHAIRCIHEMVAHRGVRACLGRCVVYEVFQVLRLLMADHPHVLELRGVLLGEVIQRTVSAPQPPAFNMPYTVFRTHGTCVSASYTKD